MTDDSESEPVLPDDTERLINIPDVSSVLMTLERAKNGAIYLCQWWYGKSTVLAVVPPTAPAFPEHAASLTLHHNEHKSVYQPVAEWIAEQEQGDNCWFEWVSPEQRQKAIDTDSVLTLQWYPNTPVGFNALAAADLDVLLEASK